MEQVLSALGGAAQGVHPFVIYLAGINALTFILFSIDCAIARYNQDEDTGLMDGRILTLFAVAGGALGMRLTLMLFTRNHMNKHNITWWFSAIVLSSGCASPTIRRPSGISRRGYLPLSSCTSHCFFLPTAPGLFRGTLNGGFGQHADDPISHFCSSRHRTVRMR